MPSNTDNLSKPSDHTRWDRLGIIGSALCVAHCALTPILLGFFSAAGLGFLGDEIFHKIFAVGLVIVALFAFWPGFRSHRNFLVLLLGSLGVVLLISAGFVIEPLLSHGFAIAVTITGSILLLTAHAANWRLTSELTCCAGH